MANDHDSVKSPETIADLPDQSIASEQAGQNSNQAGASSVDFSVLAENPEFNAFIEKKVQSKQDSRLGSYDTRLGKLESNQEETIAKYESLLAGGMSKGQALDRIKLDKKLEDLEQAVGNSGNKVAPSVGTGEKSWGEKQQAILDNAGIAKDDPRIVELLRASKSKQEFIANLEEKSFAWKQADVSKPQPSAGTVAQTIPSVPTGDGTYTKEKYKQDMLAARGKPDELKRIKAAAKADGVPVDQIGFI